MRVRQTWIRLIKFAAPEELARRLVRFFDETFSK